jgi:predicted ribosome quality control (RQC) complex YloA/Tae2 family protein
VAVDYTERRHVRKPPGARPGVVTYTHARTVSVRPALPPNW